ncbi:hypothetical protein TeGR_g8493 [Tetraparma gracilis]|uniref:Uncharacterized protein n=1 Tax=Tetraparma gracilis TaxID=2962635 RepID=A0ABQ6M9E5_9STRA|nr:hypothetical protein TeGR_g8493 [Tetraparma gracilis]
MPTASARGGSCNDCPVEGDDAFVDECTFEEEDCVCRVVGMTCYKQFGYAYDAWVIVMFLLFFYEFLYSLRCSIKATKERFARAKKDPKTGHFQPLDKIVIFATLGNLLRCIWIIHVWPGMSNNDNMFGSVAHAVLLKLPQILWQSGYLYLTLVWRKLLQQMERMKKGDRKSEVAMVRKVNIATFVFALICIPLSFIGTTTNESFTDILNLIQLLSGVTLVVMAKRFGWELASKMQHIAKAATLIETIRSTINMASVATVVLFATIMFNFYAQSRFGGWWMYCLYTFIHFSEFVLSHSLMLTKRAQENKKIAEAKYSERTRNANGTTMTSSAESVYESTASQFDSETGDARL